MVKFPLTNIGTDVTITRSDCDFSVLLAQIFQKGADMMTRTYRFSGKTSYSVSWEQCPTSLSK